MRKRGYLGISAVLTAVLLSGCGLSDTRAEDRANRGVSDSSGTEKTGGIKEYYDDFRGQ